VQFGIISLLAVRTPIVVCELSFEKVVLNLF